MGLSKLIKGWKFMCLMAKPHDKEAEDTENIMFNKARPLRGKCSVSKMCKLLHRLTNLQAWKKLK